MAIDFKNDKIWDKTKLHATIHWMKNNLIIRQECGFSLKFMYCSRNKEPYYFNKIRCIDKYEELKDTTFTCIKNAVSYYYNWLVTK